MLAKSIIFKFFIIFSAIFSISGAIQAQEIRGIKLSRSYVPQGFDDNDNATLVVEGYLPSECYRIGFLEKKVEGNQIILNQKTYFYKMDGCARRATHFKQDIFLGILPEGTYQIVDKNSNEVLDILPIKKANKLTPDDLPYANVLDVNYTEENSNPTANLELELPNSCWEVDEVRVEKESNDVVTVLPIIKHTGNNICAQAVVHVVKKVDLSSLERGKYLLHVRSVSGKAVTKLIRVSLKDGQEEKHNN